MKNTILILCIISLGFAANSQVDIKKLSSPCDCLDQAISYSEDLIKNVEKEDVSYLKQNLIDHFNVDKDLIVDYCENNYDMNEEVINCENFHKMKGLIDKIDGIEKEVKASLKGTAYEILIEETEEATEVMEEEFQEFEESKESDFELTEEMKEKIIYTDISKLNTPCGCMDQVIYGAQQSMKDFEKAENLSDKERIINGFNEEMEVVGPYCESQFDMDNEVESCPNYEEFREVMEKFMNILTSLEVEEE